MQMNSFTGKQLLAMIRESDYAHAGEDEAILKKRNKRKANGEREVPPQKCPICKMLEWARRMVLSGKVSPAKALFRFTGDFPDETQVLHIARHSER